ncbi:MAG TPA: hypothetical protein VD886_17860 [Herpetosiphonaceae bacterium]|nr:hypothetical protein [Herpetosiphonaceae bacterium]
MNEHEIAQVRQALSGGDKAAARAILAAAVRANPADGQAWFLLSETVDDAAQKRDCLQRALRAQPDNLAARSALARLDAPPAAAQPAAPPAAPPAFPDAPPADRFAAAAPAYRLSAAPAADQAAPAEDPFAAPPQPLVPPEPAGRAPSGPVYGLPSATAAPPAKKSPLSTILIGIGAGLVLGALLILGIVLLRKDGSGGSGAQVASATEAPGATPTRRAPRPTATPDFSQPGGVLVSPVPGAPTPTPLPVDEIPPSLPISELVPFTHEPTGITGLRPANWSIFSGDDSFQVSSSPEAPDGFVGALLPPEKYESGSPEATTRMIFDSLKVNSAEGPAPVIAEESYAEDGGGVLLAETTGTAQGSDKPFRFTIYARSTVTPKGLLLVFATVPTELYTGEAELVRQMVDSLSIK